MAQANPDLERDLRRLRREQLIEEEGRSRDEDRWRELEEARQQEEEHRRQMAEEERRQVLAEEQRRLEEEERQMIFFEEERRKHMDDQLSSLRRQRQQIIEQRRQAPVGEFGDGSANARLPLSPQSDTEQNRMIGARKRTSDKTPPSDTKYESFNIDKTHLRGELDGSYTGQKIISETRDTTEKKRSTFANTPEELDRKEDVMAILSTEIKKLDTRLAMLGHDLSKSVEQTKTREDSPLKPKQLFRERTSQEFRFPREDKEPLKKSITMTPQGAIPKTRGDTETYSGHERKKRNGIDCTSRNDGVVQKKTQRTSGEGREVKETGARP